jgi:uncharacterized RDD family membrane protein YckC
MAHDLQIANIWKRMAAWLFDGILTGVIAVAFGLVLSALLGYDGYSVRLEDAYVKYETEYAVTFEISQETYEAMTEAERENYNAAYEALVADQDAMYAYNMMISLSLVIISLGILFAVVLWEFVMPLWLGHGRTLGKKIFGLCLVRSDGVKMNTMQLFTRSILGKYSIEIMIPVLILLMIFWGVMGVMGTMVLTVLTAGQVFSILVTKSHCAIHDLLAGTVVVDYASQMIFPTTEDLIEHQKRIAADRAARSDY